MVTAHLIEEKLSNILLLLPWIKGDEIIMTAGESEISSVTPENQRLSE
jgi:hypothetical protein